MSTEERGFGIDMVPMLAADFVAIDPGPAEPVAQPATETERDGTVNLDTLRQVCHARVDAFIDHVRLLSPERPIVASTLTRLVAQDMERALQQYLTTERTFRTRR